MKGSPVRIWASASLFKPLSRTQLGVVPPCQVGMPRPKVKSGQSIAETKQMLLLIIVAVGSTFAVVIGLGFLAMTATLAAMSSPFSDESGLPTVRND